MTRSTHDRAMAVRAGKTGLCVWSPRVWRWKALVTIQLASSVPLLGIVGYYDEDEEKWCLGIGVGFQRIDIEPIRCMDARERDRALDALVAVHSPDLDDALDRILREAES